MKLQHYGCDRLVEANTTCPKCRRHVFATVPPPEVVVIEPPASSDGVLRPCDGIKRDAIVSDVVADPPESDPPCYPKSAIPKPIVWTPGKPFDIPDPPGYLIEPTISNRTGEDHRANTVQWIVDNPKPFAAFIRRALEKARTGTPFGAKQLGEQIRRDEPNMVVNCKSGFKICNNYIAYIGRALYALYPDEFHGLIRFRKVGR